MDGILDDDIGEFGVRLMPINVYGDAYSVWMSANSERGMEVKWMFGVEWSGSVFMIFDLLLISWR
jgi:hypothetical protein